MVKTLKRRAFGAPLYLFPNGIYTDFFLRARCALKSPCFSKISSSQIAFFGPCLVFGAASGCKTLLFASVFQHRKNASARKTLGKNLAFGHLRGPARALIARPPPPEGQKTRPTERVTHVKISAPKNPGVLTMFSGRSVAIEVLRRKRGASPRLRDNAR